VKSKTKVLNLLVDIFEKSLPKYFCALKWPSLIAKKNGEKSSFYKESLVGLAHEQVLYEIRFFSHDH
jgi:hypothetical protein